MYASQTSRQRDTERSCRPDSKPIRLPTAAEQRQIIRDHVETNAYVDEHGQVIEFAELPEDPAPDEADNA